jgi:dienelactone hydrolase
MSETVRDRLKARFGPVAGRLSVETDAPDGRGRAPLSGRYAGGAETAGWLCHPDTPPPWPVVLVIHAHGGRYDLGARELVEGRPAQPGPLGPDLAARGLASVCLDLPCFGARSDVAERPAAKAALWRGGSLAGAMIGELVAQVSWLEADARFGRIGACGLSMGATLGYWLASIEPRIAALAQLCCLADLDRLIASGAHDLHGDYMTVPGLPAIARNGQIAGLVAPRPQLVCLGARDPLTPPDALAVALEDLRAGYAAAPEALRVLVDPDVGHVETPAMRAAVLDFLAGALR